MTLRPCARFNKLTLEGRDRVLTAKELRFVEEHRSRCRRCAESENALNTALNLLSGSVLETPALRPRFERRLFRRLRVECARSSLRYWTPAIIGAFVTAAIFLAALQVATATKKPVPFSPGASEARRITSEPVLPDLDGSPLRR